MAASNLAVQWAHEPGSVATSRILDVSAAQTDPSVLITNQRLGTDPVSRQG